MSDHHDPSEVVQITRAELDDLVDATAQRIIEGLPLAQPFRLGPWLRDNWQTVVLVVSIIGTVTGHADTIQDLRLSP